MSARAALAAVPDASGRRVPTVEQAKAIGVLVLAHKPTEVTITYEPFDLPAGWVLVQLRPGLKAGIDPNGRVEHR